MISPASVPKTEFALKIPCYPLFAPRDNANGCRENIVHEKTKEWLQDSFKNGVTGADGICQ